MNTVTKILLTINLEGGTLHRQSEPEFIEYKLTKKALHPNFKYKGNEGHQVIKQGSIEHHPLIAQPASLHINMTLEAYKYFISKECPEWSTPKIWRKMKEKEKLEAHLQRTCDHFRGKSYSYELLETN